MASSGCWAHPAPPHNRIGAGIHVEHTLSVFFGNFVHVYNAFAHIHPSISVSSSSPHPISTSPLSSLCHLACFTYPQNPLTTSRVFMEVEDGQPNSGHAPEKSDSPYPSGYQLPIAPCPREGPHAVF